MPDDLVEDILPEDFATLRVALTKTLVPVSLGNKITRFRMIFKFAYDELLIDRPVRYGRVSKSQARECYVCNGKNEVTFKVN